MIPIPSGSAPETGSIGSLWADALPRSGADRQCRHCGAELKADDQGDRCLFCGEKLAWQDLGVRRHPVLKLVIWLAEGYRVWSLGLFVAALIPLLRIGDVKSLFFGFIALFPFGMALWIAFRTRPATSRWIVAFIVLVDLGVIVAPFHGVLPWLNMFPEIPRTENRILSWYCLVYTTLQFGVAPPVVLGRCLHTAWRGGRTALAPWICVFGLAVWLLLVSVAMLGVITSWPR